MPDRRTHVIAGAALGGIAALIRTSHSNSPQAGLESLTTIIFSVLGAAAPDVLEPATSPQHRTLMHSLVVGGGLALATFKQWDARCRENAAQCERAAIAHVVGCPQRVQAENNALLWRLAAAALVGFAVGYASHLVLDGQTARSIPVIFS